MGFYRYFLAVLVLLSHADTRLFGFNPGVVAVISFYLISGFVMTLLIGKYYYDARRIGAFYLDRCIRLFPQFLFYSIVTILLAGVLVLSSRWLANCTIGDYAMNLVMLPIGYFKLFENNCLVIPQAWSLGLELSFYLMIPLTLLHPHMVKWVAVASLAVFIAAYIGFIDTDLFGYRLLPGTFFIFLMGAALANPKLFWPGQNLCFWLLSLLMFNALFANPAWMDLKYNKEVLLGIVIGVPALAALSRLTFSRYDAFVGNLSYGVFLNHFVFIYIFEWLGFTADSIAEYLALVALSSGAALASYYLIERPALKMRHKIRADVRAGQSVDFDGQTTASESGSTR